MRSGSFFCGLCDTQPMFASWSLFVVHVTTNHRQTGVCDYCGMRGEMITSGIKGVVTSTWCPDEQRCDERSEQRTAALR